MIKHILFDVDGMLIIRDGYFSERFTHEYDVSPQMVQKFFQNEFNQVVIGKSDLKQVLKPYLKEWGWNKSVDEFLQYWFVSEKHVERKILSYVDQLRKKDIGCHLATNQEKYRLQFLWQELDFKSHFDTAFSSCNFGYKKPQPEYFDKILRHLSVKPENIMFWDDKKENIREAKSLGLKAFLYKDFKEFKKVVEAKI